jgi:hypothetical protein
MVFRQGTASQFAEIVDSEQVLVAQLSRILSHAGRPGRSLEQIAKSGRATVASLDEVRAVFETNLFGVIAVTRAKGVAAYRRFTDTNWRIANSASLLRRRWPALLHSVAEARRPDRDHMWPPTGADRSRLEPAVR